MAPDALLSALVTEYPTRMLAVHATAIAKLRGSTDASTVTALRRAGASDVAAHMLRLLDEERARERE